jgi:hypothetical protein
MKNAIRVLFALLAGALASAPAMAAGSWNVAQIGSGDCAGFSWGSGDGGDAQPALKLMPGTVWISAEVTGTVSVSLYVTPAPGSNTPASTGELAATITGNTRAPISASVNGGYVLDPDIDTAGTSGTIYVCLAGLGKSGGSGSGAGVAVASYGGMKACLESPKIEECVLTRLITLPAGANNVITWRTGQSGNGRDLKTLRCANGGWIGTNDSVVDAASLTFDLSLIPHDGEVTLRGCNVDGAPTDGDTYGLRFAGLVTPGAYIKVRVIDNHFGGLGSASTRVHFDSNMDVSALWWERNWWDFVSGTNLGHWIDYDGARAGATGQGARFWFLHNDTTPVTSNGGLIDFTGSVSTETAFTVKSLSNNWAGGADAAGQTNGFFQFGQDQAPEIEVRDTWHLGTGRSIPCLFSQSGTGGGTLKGDISFGGVSATADYGALYCVQGAGYGFESVDLTVQLQPAATLPFDIRLIAFADTGATVGAQNFRVRVHRGGAPSGVDRPNLFDRTFLSKLITEATARGQIEIGGGIIPIVAGRMGSFTWGPMIERTFASLTGVADNAVMTATMPSTVLRAACFTEDTTGSATFNLYRGTSATLLHSASQACGFRKTDGAATTCPTCTGGVAQTATLTSTPEDSSIICSSTTPATSFQISPNGSCRNKTNITTCSKAQNATTISWTPTATVTANLSCTYDTIPAWVDMTQNQAFAVGDVLGFRTTAGFGNTPAGARTFLFVETRPTN